MRVLKALELALRRLLLRALAAVGRKKTPLPPHIDFSNSKFLFVRQDRIGDVLVSTPLFHALSRRYPNARLDIIVSRNNVVAVEHNRAITKTWLYTKRAADVIGMLRAIRRERYDFVIDLMDNPSATSTVLVLLSGARWSVGLDKENGFAYDLVVPLRSRKETHIVDRLSEILRVFGIDPASEDLRIHYDPVLDARESAARYWGSAHLEGKIVIGLNISAGSDARFWGVDRYRALVERLQALNPDYGILLLAKAGDEERTSSIASDRRGVLVAPRGSFDHFAALISRVSALITPDTAAVHLCAAFGVPSVVLYVQSNKDLRIWDPYRTPSEAVISSEQDLSPISVDDVFTAFERLSRRVPMIPRKLTS